MQLTKQSAHLAEVSQRQARVCKEAEAAILQVRKLLKDVKEVPEPTKESLKQLLMRIRSV